MNAASDRARAHALIDELFGEPDSAAEWSVAVLHAHAAALAWVRVATGSYPAPETVAARLQTVADRLRGGDDRRDPAQILRQAAVDALTAHRSADAA